MNNTTITITVGAILCFVLFIFVMKLSEPQPVPGPPYPTTDPTEHVDKNVPAVTDKELLLKKYHKTRDKMKDVQYALRDPALDNVNQFSLKAQLKKLTEECEQIVKEYADAEKVLPCN